MLKKATHQQTKQHNTRLILKTLYDNQSLSRAELARRTHLTRPTVSTIVGELIEEGLVVVTGPGESLGGKRPLLLEVDAHARELLCIDIGNQEFRGAVVNMRGKLLQQETLPAEEISGEAAVEQVFQLVERLQAHTTRPLLGIGVGTPGLIDPHEGSVRQAVNLRWENLPLRDRMFERFGVPIYLANDSQAAALAEYTFGEETGSSNLILLKVGRGIGAGIVINGRLFYGDGFGAGEIGHIGMLEEGDHLLTLEDLASTRALLARAQLPWPEIVAAYAEKSSHIQPLVDQAAKYLGVAVAHLIGGFNIHQLVISGRVAYFGPAFLDTLIASARRYTLPAMVDRTTVRFTSLGNHAVLRGCSALIVQQELGVL